MIYFYLLMKYIENLSYDGNKHYSVLNLKGLEENTIVIDSTSKRYSMCGIRVGCIVSKNKEVMSTV